MSFRSDSPKRYRAENDHQKEGNKRQRSRSPARYKDRPRISYSDRDRDSDSRYGDRMKDRREHRDKERTKDRESQRDKERDREGHRDRDRDRGTLGSKHKMPSPKRPEPAVPVYTGSMIEVICNDRLGKKIRVKCNEDDTVGDLKKLIAAQTGTDHRKIVLKKWYTSFKDHIKLSDYEIHNGMSLELYYVSNLLILVINFLVIV